MTTADILSKAKAACFQASALTTEKKNEALLAMADALTEEVDTLLAANAIDLDHAKDHLSESMMDRLRLTKERIEGMATGIREVSELPDPVGRILQESRTPGGLQIRKVSVPLGVVGIIYEARPNVTSDAAALALKSGNVCVLRSGRDAFHSANAIVDVMREALAKVDVDRDMIQLIQDTSRASATEMMKANGYIDMLIPRGGAGLIRSCVENATVPCIQTGTGICHVYVEKSADQEMALNIIENAKTSRPSVCNAEECLLVDEAIAAEFLPKVRKRLTTMQIEKGKTAVELRLDEKAAQIIDGTPASETDFDTEFLDYILAVKLVEGPAEAIRHIADHSTHHSEAIVTADAAIAEQFFNKVDSAAVYWNASTRFTDGGEFGLGCEMGISTQKLHARGPMGLCELTAYQYRITGNGQIR